MSNINTCTLNNLESANTCTLNDLESTSINTCKLNFPISKFCSDYPTPPKISFKQRQVEDYVKLYEEGPKQGGEEWLDKKRKTIGGSEMASLIGSSIFKGVRELIESKVGITKWSGDYRTHWGNLFEPVIQTFIEYDKNIKIIGTEIWILGQSQRQSYSPDGLSTMMINYEHTIEEKQPDGTVIQRIVILPEEKTVLHEFKCPFSRHPGREPPKWYVPQVKTGLDTIPIADVGLYTEAIFRRCCYLDLQMDNDDFTQTFTQKTRCGGKLPIAMGFIGFYFDPTQSRSKKHQSDIRVLIKYFREEETVGVVDAGEMPDAIFECMLRAFINGVLVPWYSEIAVRGAGDGAHHSELLQKNYDEFFDFCFGNFKPYCVLPWKLFRIDYHFIDKEPGYVEGYMDRINEVMDVVDACGVDPNNADAIISSYFNKDDDYYDD